MCTSLPFLSLLDYRIYAEMVPDSSLIFYQSFLICYQSDLSKPKYSHAIHLLYTLQCLPNAKIIKLKFPNSLK